MKRVKYHQADVGAVLMALSFVPIVISGAFWAWFLCIVTFMSGLLLLLTKWRF